MEVRIMGIIKNEKEREQTFLRLWNEEIKINPQHYEVIHGNDLRLLEE